MLNLYKALFSYILLIFISINAYSQYTEWEKDVVYHDIQFKKVRFLIESNDTLIIQGVVKKEAIVNGIPCKRGVVLINDWELKTFILADDYTIDGVEYPEWTKINHGQKGTLIFLGEDMEYQGYCCNGNYKKWYSTGIHTTLYPNGRLKGFYPCQNVVIDNIPCKSSPFANVHLHPNGKLKDCTLYAEYEIEGKMYKKNTHVSFDENGKLIRADKYVLWWLRK